jgi:hypothetical protein
VSVPNGSSILRRSRRTYTSTTCGIERQLIDAQHRGPLRAAAATARDLTHAQYAALRILDERRRELAQFRARGVDARRAGAPTRRPPPRRRSPSADQRSS